MTFFKDNIVDLEEFIFLKQKIHCNIVSVRLLLAQPQTTKNFII
jgi:hypothetical protein